LYCIIFLSVLFVVPTVYTYLRLTLTNVLIYCLLSVLLFIFELKKIIVIPLKYPSPSPSPLLIPPSPLPQQQQISNKDIMIPSSSSSELEGNGPDNNNGTKFWIEGTSPEAAMEKIQHVLSDGSNSGDDDDDGIEITPSLGSGILFNGYVRGGVVITFSAVICLFYSRYSTIIILVIIL
jgi:hypothetical protein